MARTIRSFQNIATVLNRGQDLNQLLRDILDQIIAIVSQERGAIYLYSSHEHKLDLAVNRGLELPASLQASRLSHQQAIQTGMDRQKFR